jgi:hypothetical protein
MAIPIVHVQPEWLQEALNANPIMRDLWQTNGQVFPFWRNDTKMYGSFAHNVSDDEKLALTFFEHNKLLAMGSIDLATKHFTITFDDAPDKLKPNKTVFSCAGHLSPSPVAPYGTWKYFLRIGETNFWFSLDIKQEDISSVRPCDQIAIPEPRYQNRTTCTQTIDGMEFIEPRPQFIPMLTAFGHDYGCYCSRCFNGLDKTQIRSISSVEHEPIDEKQNMPYIDDLD